MNTERTKWTYDKCYEIAKSCKTKSEFKDVYPKAYSAAKYHKWLKDYTWLIIDNRKPNGYWNYEHCLIEAKKYETSYDFREGNECAYNIARRNGWLDDYTWFKVHERHYELKWTYDTCYEEAKKYKTKSSFGKNCGAAYSKALTKGWLDDYTWFKKVNHKPYTYEEVYQIALNYEYKIDFSKGNHGAYQAANKHGWMKFFDWFLDGNKRATEERRKWNYETCYKEAQKYATRTEFQKSKSGAYNTARHNGWIKDYEWLKDRRFDLFLGKIDSVYSYEFIEFNAVYVGRTLMKQQKTRDYQHIFYNDTVSIFAKENNVAVPKMKILEENLTLEEGCTKEDEWVERYKAEGWNILNKVKTGSIGGLSQKISKYNYDRCYQAALDCENRGEFYRKYNGEYQYSSKKKWLNDFYWLGEPKKIWDYESCYEEAKKYETLAEFRKNALTAYNSAHNKGWLNDFTWLVRKEEIWTKEACLEESKKYKSRGEFANGSHSAYCKSLERKWIEEFTWLNNEKRHPNGYWTKERCIEEGKKYNTKTEWQKGSYHSYYLARTNKWLKDCTWLKNNK